MATVEQRVTKLEATLKGLQADIKKRKLSTRVEKLEKIVNKKPGHGHGKDK